MDGGRASVRVRRGRMVEKRKRGVREASSSAGSVRVTMGAERGGEEEGEAEISGSGVSGDSSQFSYSLTDHSTILLQSES